MKKLTLDEARQQIEDRETWLWRQEHWGHSEESDFDAELETTGYQAVGAAGDYWEVPNR